MPRGQIGGREIVVDKRERKEVSVGFSGLILEYWLWRKLYHFKLYYYMRNVGVIKIEFIALFY
jgi:hypothetical protein